MKITIVLGAFFPVPLTMGGGVEKVWFSLAPEFVKRGHEVVIVSRKTPGLSREETIDGVKQLRVDGFDTHENYRMMSSAWSAPACLRA